MSPLTLDSESLFPSDLALMNRKRIMIKRALTYDERLEFVSVGPSRFLDIR